MSEDERETSVLETQTSAWFTPRSAPTGRPVTRLEFIHARFTPDDDVIKGGRFIRVNMGHVVDVRSDGGGTPD